MPDWTYTPSGSSRADIDVDSNGNSYFNTVDGGVESLDSNGNSRWTVDPNGSDTTGVRSLTLNDAETRVFVSYGSELYILNASDGSTLNSSSGSDNIGDIYGLNSDTNIVGVNSSNGDVEIIDATSFGSTDSYNPSRAIDNIEVQGSYIYAATSDGHVHKLNKSDLSLVREEEVEADFNAVDVHDANSETFWYGYNGNLHEVDTSQTPWVFNWDVTAEDTDVQYDPVDDELYTTGGGNDNTINRINATDGSRYRFLSSGTYSGFGQVAVPSGSKVIVGAGFGDIVKYDDSEFTTPLTSVNATQYAGTASMNSGSPFFKEQITSTQYAGNTSMNPTTVFTYPTAKATMNAAQVTATSATSSQFAATASMNTTTLPITVTASMNTTALTDEIDAVGSSAAGVMNTADANTLDTAVRINDKDGNEYLVTGILYEGQHPTLREGETTTLTLFTDDTETYENFQDYDLYLNEDTIQSGNSYYNKPWYREILNPDANVSSYLWKFRPASNVVSLDSWWVVVTAISDRTQMYGTGYQFEVQLLALTPVNGETFTEIENEYER